MPISDDPDCIFKGRPVFGCPHFFVHIVFNQTIVKRLRGVFGLFTLGERTVDIDTPIC